MPINDLRTFELLQATPDAEVVLPPPSSTATPATATTAVGDVKETTWEAAVRRLWLTPQPRCIVALGGGAAGFRVVGGKGCTLRLTSATTATATSRANLILRCADDALGIVLSPPSTTASWVAASPEDARDQDLTAASVVLLSGHASFALGAADTTPLYLLAPDPEKCGYLAAAKGLPDAQQRWELRITNRVAASTPRDLALADDPFPQFKTPPSKLRAAGSVEVDVAHTPPAAGHGAGATAVWRMHRCTGDTRVAYAPPGRQDDTQRRAVGSWHRMAYGWVIQPLASAGAAGEDSRLLQLRGHGDLRGPVRWLGCWRDSRDARNLPQSADIGTGSRDAVRSCMEAAAQRNQRLVGVQAGWDCNFGNDPTAAQRNGPAPQETDCDQTDSEGRPTGGDWRMALYGLSDTAWFALQDYPQCKADGCTTMPGNAQKIGRRYLLPDGRALVAKTACNGCLDAVMGQAPGWTGEPTPGSLLDQHFASDAAERDTRVPVTVDVGSGARARFLGLFRDSGDDRVLPLLLEGGVADVAAAARLAARRSRRLFGVEAGGECWVRQADKDAETDAAGMAAAMRLGGLPLAQSARDAAGRYMGAGWAIALYLLDDAAVEALAPVEDYPACKADLDRTECLREGKNQRPGKRYRLPDGRCLKAKSECWGCLDQAASGHPDWTDGPRANEMLDAHFESCETDRDTRRPLTRPLSGANGSATYLGCVADKGDDRAMQLDPNPVAGAADCARKAGQFGHRLFGLEAGNQCLTSNDLTQAIRHGPSAQCSDQLDANGFATGGPWAISLYRMDDNAFDTVNGVETPFPACKAWGCLRDGRNQIPGKRYKLQDGRCLKAKGECWGCLDAVASGDIGWATDAAKLDTAFASCEADSDTRLAKLLPLSGANGAAWHLGCIADNGDDRAMANLGQVSSVAECAKRSGSRGNRTFGVEAGSICMSTYDRDRARRHGPSAQCTDAKDGYGHATGGPMAISLYEMDDNAFSTLGVADFPACKYGEEGCLANGKHQKPGMRYRLPDGRCLKAKGECWGCLEAAAMGHPDWTDGPEANDMLNTHFESCQADRDTRQPLTRPLSGANGSATYLGCVADQGDDRAMDLEPVQVAGAADCARIAARRGRRLFGLEAGNQCLTSDDLTRATRHGPSAQCSDQRDANGFATGGPWAISLYRMDDNAYETYQNDPIHVHVGSSTTRYKQVNVPDGTMECELLTTVGSDRYWSQLDVTNRKLNVYRLDANSGWGNDLYVRCGRGNGRGGVKQPPYPYKQRLFFGPGAGADKKNLSAHVPHNTVCPRPCGPLCYGLNDTNSVLWNYGGAERRLPLYQDTICVDPVNDNTVNLHRCDAAGNGVDDSFTFDVEMDCELSSW